jgi:hypothetical protein
MQLERLAEVRAAEPGDNLAALDGSRPVQSGSALRASARPVSVSERIEEVDDVFLVLPVIAAASTCAALAAFRQNAQSWDAAALHQAHLRRWRREQ